MKRLIVSAITIGLLGAACAGTGAVRVSPLDQNPSPSTTSKPRPTTSKTPTTEPSSTPSETSTPTGTLTVHVWFTQGEHLFLATRSQAATVAVGRAALTQLLAGPTSQERDAGVGTTIPAGTELIDLNIQDGVATVDMNGAYDDGGGSLSMRMRLAEVVYTITQFPSVQGVDFQLDGSAVEAFSGEGIVLDHPQTRADFEDLLPAIVVETPGPGDAVSSPLTISGTANVFEATVSYRIEDENGHSVADGYATATCGTGCRGTYVVTVDYQVGHDQQGTVVVFESSAQDGSEINVVRIPVTLKA
jgi:spore germination protein GerM